MTRKPKDQQVRPNQPHRSTTHRRTANRGKKKKAGLRDRHKLVLDYYYGVSNMNKTDAMRRAGYAAPNRTLDLFRREDVMKEMERREARIRKKYEVTYDRIMEETAKVAFSSILDFAEIDDEGHVTIDLGKATADELRALGEVTVETDKNGVQRIKVKPWNKLEALDKLIRHSGLSRDKAAENLGNLADAILSARERISREED